MVFDQHFRIVASKDPLEEGPIVEGQGGQKFLGIFEILGLGTWLMMGTSCQAPTLIECLEPSCLTLHITYNYYKCAHVIGHWETLKL
jgi:hypothetical protein